MMLRWTRSYAAAAGMITVALVAIMLPHSQAQPQTREPAKPEEYLILGDANRGAGEPMIAVNRRDPDNIVIVAMATLHRLPNGEAPDGPIPPAGPGVGSVAHSMTQRVRELSTQDETVTDIAVTRNGGKTWEFSTDRFRQFFKRNRCHDSFAGAGPDGTMYFGCIPHIASDNTDFDQGYTPGGEPKNMRGGSAIAWSEDKGHTWSDPVWVHPDHAPQLYAPNLAGRLRFEYASPWDRPYFAADDSTGAIYVSGSGGGTFIRASHDRGRTWGTIYPLVSDDYPGGGRFGSTFSAGHGLLVTVYNATRVPEELHAQCPCPVLGASTDDGKTWAHYVLPNVPPEPGALSAPVLGRGGRGGPIGPSYLVAVDPSRSGHYALARAGTARITVSLTEDGGKTWNNPVTVAEVPSGHGIGHRGMKFSPRGDLALFWLNQTRGDYPGGGYDVWTAVSRDAGKTFQTARLSSDISPVVSRERGNFLFGNDLSSMDVDDQFVHVVWGDNRAGFLGTWYGRMPLNAQTPPAHATTNNEAPKSDEFLLLGSPNRGAGEPIIFVNPKDPDNMIVVAMATLNRLPGGETPIPRGSPGAAELRVKELSTPDGSRTDIAVTRDGGKTWQFSEDHFRQTFNKNRCSDSFAGAGPDGTLYMGCLAYLNRGSADYDEGYAPNGEAKNMHGGSAIAWSMDQGSTWSYPKWVHPDHSPDLYAPNLKPVLEQASPWDRPIFAADASSGTIYLSGSGLAYTVDPATLPPPKVDPTLPAKGYTGYPPASIARGRTFIRASHDQARTWGVIYAIDSDEYPGGRGGFTAAHGNLAVAYTAAKVPENLNAHCPCTVFGTSKDDGKTFEYHLVPPLAGTATQAAPPAAGGGRGGGGAAGGILVAADPTREGRYALARQSGQTILIILSQDGGRSWSQPVVAARVPDGVSFGHRAMKYSAKGDLVLIWKAIYPDRSFDVWSSASRDGGSVFYTARVSHAVSPPYIPERGNFLFGDDLSSVDVDERYVHIVWGDNRSGFEAAWYARLPLDAY